MTPHSSEPVASHAVPGPLDLTDPAPLEAAAGLGAHHVHAAAVALRGRVALGARLRHQADGERARVDAVARVQVVPARAQHVVRERLSRGGGAGGAGPEEQRVLSAVADVEALEL